MYVMELESTTPPPPRNPPSSGGGGSSETQLSRRYKGIRSSKNKKSLHSSTDFYSHVFKRGGGGGGGDGSEEDDEDDEDHQDSLGPRSLSLSALVTPGDGGPGNGKHFSTSSISSSSKVPSLNLNRMSQLETLEAKMASIEVSLANVAAAAAQQQHQSVASVSATSSSSHAHILHNHSSAHSTHSAHSASGGGGGGGGPRRTKRSLLGSARSQLSAPSSSSRDRDRDRDRDREQQQQLIHKELEVLRGSLKDKDNLILNLQGQLRKLSQRRLVHGSITSTDSGVLSLRILSESERKSAEERLTSLDKDMEVKRGDIAAINLRLGRLRPSDNIDTRIEQAELEYELEREELNLMNLAEERRNLHTILDDNDTAQKRKESSIYASIPLGGAPVALHSFEVLYSSEGGGGGPGDKHNNKSFTVGKRENRPGTWITWTRDDNNSSTSGSSSHGKGGGGGAAGGLKRGDRIVEINGTLVINKGVNRLEEFWLDDDHGIVGGSGEEEEDRPGGHSSSSSDFFSSGSSHPLRIVVMREPPPPPPPRAPNRELHTVREELALVTAKLEQVAKEKREAVGAWNQIQSQLEPLLRLRSEGEATAKERDLLRTEGVRLKHRISYLEEQVSELVGEKGSGPSATCQVFQKGSQRTIVGDPPQHHSRPPSVTSSKKGCSGGGGGGGEGQSRSGAFRSRLWETFRRATLGSSDARSVCSVESSALTEAGYFAKKRNKKSGGSKGGGGGGRNGSGNGWPPPSKPLRLSLQRATSSSEVYSALMMDGGGGGGGGGGHHHNHAHSSSSVDLHPGILRGGGGGGGGGSRPSSNHHSSELGALSGNSGDEGGGGGGNNNGRGGGVSNGKKSRKSGGGGGGSGGGIRWPSLRPASSMSYAMPSSTHPPNY